MEGIIIAESVPILVYNCFNLIFRCSMIVHVEYRCPECDKVFNCPANLASHRRWHKPKQQANGLMTPSKMEQQQQDGNSCCSCDICGRTFKKYGTMRKHLQTHHQQEANNNNKLASATDSPSPGKSYSIDTLLSPTKAAVKAAYSCHICRAVFETGRQLESHCFEQCRPPPSLPPPPPPKEQQLPSPKQLISCPACPQLTFPDLHQLTRHAARFHLPPPPQQQLEQRFHFPLPLNQSSPPNNTSLLSIAALASRS